MLNIMMRASGSSLRILRSRSNPERSGSCEHRAALQLKARPCYGGHESSLVIHDAYRGPKSDNIVTMTTIDPIRQINWLTQTSFVQFVRTNCPGAKGTCAYWPALRQPKQL